MYCPPNHPTFSCCLALLPLGLPSPAGTLLSLTHSLTPSRTHSLTHSLKHSFKHVFPYSLTAASFTRICCRNVFPHRCCALCQPCGVSTGAPPVKEGQQRPAAESYQKVASGHLGATALPLWRSRGFSGVTFALSWSPTSEGGAAESDTLQLAVERVSALHCLRALKHVAAGIMCQCAQGSCHWLQRAYR
jgi:hypothetical protein